MIAQRAEILTNGVIKRHFSFTIFPRSCCYDDLCILICFSVGEVRNHWFLIHHVRKDAIGHTKGAYRLLKPGKSFTEDSRTAFAWWVVLLQVEEIKIT